MIDLRKTVLLALLIGVNATVATAGPLLSTKCAISKSKAAAKRVLSEVKCWQKAFAAGAETPDAECMSTAAQKFTDAMTKAEAKGGCLITDDSGLTLAVNACTDGIVDQTPPGTGQCYVGATSMQFTPFTSGMFVGTAAGDALCDAMFAGSNMCEYSDLLDAELLGDLAAVSDSTTFWLERDITADVAAVPSPPGPGGNCNNWTFNGNHVADGEYVTFLSGVPTYHIDNDTFYDGSDQSHVIAGDLQCTDSRSIPCCAPCP